jgi:MFS family permease
MADAPTRSRRTLAVLCAASTGWAFSFGLGAPLAALWLRDAGCSAGVVGLNTASYYLGVALAAAVTPRLMRRFGRGCITAGILLDAFATALFPWAGGAAGWFLLRLLGGAAGAVCLIPLETRVNHNAAPGRRARDFGVYAGCTALGVGLGALAGLPLYPAAPRLAFALGGVAALAAAALAHWGLPHAEPPADVVTVGRQPLRPNLISFAAAWVQGFLEGGMVAFLTLHLTALGYTEAAVSGLLGVLFAGVVLFQAPAAWLADRGGRLRALMGCLAVLFAGLVCLPFCAGPAAVGGWLFAVGGCCAALYPLGLARLGERTRPQDLARANAWYLACNCAGSLTGPVAMGAAIDGFGRPALFAVGAAATALAAAAWLAERRGVRRFVASPKREREMRPIEAVTSPRR